MKHAEAEQQAFQRYALNSSWGVQVNAKLGGTNVILDPQRMPAFTRNTDFMLFGAPWLPTACMHSAAAAARLQHSGSSKAAADC